MGDTPTPGPCILISLILVTSYQCDGTFGTLEYISLWMHTLVIFIIIFLSTVTGTTN